MTFADLLATLETRGALHASRVKDMKTSLRYLAAALGQTSLEQCPVDAACQDPDRWGAALETHFATLTAQGRTISATTRRNTRNNLRTIFRLAEASGLLTQPLPARLLTKLTRDAFLAELRATTPYWTTYHPQGPRHFGLPEAEWPPDIQAGWRAYRAQCGLRLRESTLLAHANRLVLYLGYLTHVRNRTPTWDNLFDVATVDEFVRWHGVRMGRPIATMGLAVVQTIVAIANVIKHPAHRALADFRNTLPTPEPLHIKRQHVVSLREIEAVAEACLAEGRAPYSVGPHIRHPGLYRAMAFQRGTILKLLVRIPLRQRNLRELSLGTNLYEEQGHWHLHFSGSELKIGHRGAKVNTYHVDLTEHFPKLIPVLKEFLEVYRPRLPNPTASTLCFLTCNGNPYNGKTLREMLSLAVAMRTGKRWYPHLIRTTWATEYLTSDEKPDWTTAAVMLGDKVATVMASYHDLDDEAHHPRASAFVDKQLGTG